MSKLDLIDSEEERQFYRDIHEILEHAKNTAYAAVNDIMTQTSHTVWCVEP